MTLNRARRLDLKQNRARARALKRARKLGIDIDFAIYFNLALTQTLTYVQNRNFDRTFDLARIFYFTRPLGSPIDRRELAKFFCWYCRFCAQSLTTYLSSWKKYNTKDWSRKLLPTSRDKKEREKVIQFIIDIYFDIYVAFAILEERIEGRILPVAEGILASKRK